MISVEGSGIRVSCHANGGGLAIDDTARGMTWVLDPLSLIHEASDGTTGTMVPLSASSADGRSLEIRYGAGETVVSHLYSLERGYVRVVMSTPGAAGPARVALPGAFAPAEGRCRYLLPIMQGMLWDGGGTPFEDWKWEAGHLGFSMPFIGYLGGSGALLMTVESQDDVSWWMGKDDGGRTWAANVQNASLGVLESGRECRLYPTDAGIVPVAKAYRAKIIEQGRFRPWEDRIAERPALERIFGALMCFIGYCRDDVDYAAGCKRLKDMGFDRALVYPDRFSTYHTDIRMGGVPAIELDAGTVGAIKGLGYDIAPWTWINEALDDGTGEIRALFRRNANGQPIPHWAIDSQQWYLVCSSFLEGVQRRAVGERTPEATWDHFDVLACASVGECHALDHVPHMGYPLSKTLDRGFIKRALLAGRAGGRIVSSENFNDAYSMELDLGSVKAWPNTGGPWRFRSVPLTMLVYHDSIVHSWWEIHNYNNGHHVRRNGDFFEYGGGRPRQMAALDALMGCPPDVFPFGAQYGYTGVGNETYLYKVRLEDVAVREALREALPVARLHRRIGKLEMVHFAFLTEDGSLQESAFSDGTRVVANFGDVDVPAVGDHPAVPGGGWVAY